MKIHATRTNYNNPQITQEYLVSIQDNIKQINSWWEKTKAEFYTTNKSAIGDKTANLESLCDSLINIYIKDFNKPNSLTEKINFLNSTHLKFHQRQSIAETLWLNVDPSIIQKAFEEQKHKYGTEAFKNSLMLRSLTEYSRKEFKLFIQKKLKDLKLSFGTLELLGLGFGGAAFKFTLKGTNTIPPIVLKFNIAKSIEINNFGNLENDRLELEKLKELHRPNLSQNLAYFSIISLPETEVTDDQYLIPENLKSKTLATWLSSGTNIMDIVEEQWNKFVNKQPPNESAKYFFEDGISDVHLESICLYHQEMCKKKINFYDMFPHNTLFDTSQETNESKSSVFRFIDSVTKVRPKSTEDKIVEARYEYPIDSLIFDLVSFLV